MTSLVATTPTQGDAQDQFATLVADEVQRRTGGDLAMWSKVSPTDPRTDKQISADRDAGFIAAAGTGLASLLGGVGGLFVLAAMGAPEAVALATTVSGAAGFVYCMTSGPSGLAPRLSRRYRRHRRLTGDAVLVPTVAADAYDAVHAAPTLLTSLSAPDAAVEHAVTARDEAADALTALARLVQVDDDKVWLATTEPYKRLLTLAAEVTVLANLSRDRLALPVSTGPQVMPEGLDSAAEVGAYMLAENTHVAGVLDPTGAPTTT